MQDNNYRPRPLFPLPFFGNRRVYMPTQVEEEQAAVIEEKVEEKQEAAEIVPEKVTLTSEKEEPKRMKMNYVNCRNRKYNPSPYTYRTPK